MSEHPQTQLLHVQAQQTLALLSWISDIGNFEDKDCLNFSKWFVCSQNIEPIQAHFMVNVRYSFNG